jgi:hypothetical protein
MEINNMILGLRVMRKHHTMFEVQGNRGLTPMQINEAKNVYKSNKDTKIYALTKFHNEACSRTDTIWIEINISDI